MNTDDEFVYCLVWKDENGLTAGLWWNECDFTNMDLNGHAIVGIRRDIVSEYYRLYPEDFPKATLRGWFLVRQCDNLTYDDIREAIQYG